MFGRLGGPNRERMRLGVVSNRTEKVGDVLWLFQNGAEGDNTTASTVAQSCVAQSNSHARDRSWPKVTLAERLLTSLIDKHVAGSETEAQLIDRCFELLSTDTLPMFLPGEHDWQDVHEGATAFDFRAGAGCGWRARGCRVQTWCASW